MSLYYSLDNELGKEHMGATGGFRKWLEGSMLAPYPHFVKSEVSEDNSFHVHVKSVMQVSMLKDISQSGRGIFQEHILAEKWWLWRCKKLVYYATSWD